MVSLSVAVMAHTSREHLWAPLAASLQEQSPVSLTTLVDDGTLGRWGNGRRCLLSYDENATHHLVIQDDALPARDLLAGLEEWLEVLPESILCLYSGRVRAWRNIQATRARWEPCWYKMQQIQWGVALVFPTGAIERLVDTGDRMPLIHNYDLRISEANLRTTKLPILVPGPSWVEHARAASTVPGRKPNRHALNFIGQDVSVLDWAPMGEARLVRVPEFHRRPNGQQYYRSTRPR